LVSTIKKFKVSKIIKIIALRLLLFPQLLHLVQQIKKMYFGCYIDFKKYIGPERANEYCSCNIQMLGNEYSNEEIK